MVSFALLCWGLLAAARPDQTSFKVAQSDVAAYQEAATKAGNDANTHVRLALWCEAHGLTAERIKHLSLAILANPGSAAARGLLGLVLYQGKWQRPDDLSRQVHDDPVRQAILREYLNRRVRTPDKPDDQWRLALWCAQNGLKEQATAHLRRAVTLDPKREAAWKRLGFKKQGSRWVKPEVAAAEKAEHEAQLHADKSWKQILERLSESLAAHDKTRRAMAEQALRQITDPRAVPMVWTHFVKNDQAHQGFAVRIFGQIKASGSSRALALLAVFSPWAHIRQSAAQHLRNRDPRDFAALLVELLRDLIKYKVKPVIGPGSQGELLVEGKDANVKRLYTPLPPPTLLPGFQLGTDANGMLVGSQVFNSYQSTDFSGPRLLRTASPTQFAGFLQQLALSPRALPATRRGGRLSMSLTTEVQDSITIPIGQMMADAQNSALVAQQQLSRDVQSIEANNQQVAATNERVRNILREFSGHDFGGDRRAWAKWAVDLEGYAAPATSYQQEPPPTVIEQVPIDYEPQAGPPVFAETVAAQVTSRSGPSCFGAGTAVRTLDGLRSIEDIREGDPILTQNTTTGALSYQPVMVVYHNPPNLTFRIQLDQETIVATGIHRFWKAGEGWVMARELKPGDRLRSISGIVQVKAVELDKVQLVYNLQIADGDSFFVGKEGVLAHENSIVSPSEKPFDSVPVLGELPPNQIPEPSR